MAPVPAVTDTAPTPAQENVAPPEEAASDTIGNVKATTSDPASKYVAPAPAVTSDEAEPLDTDAVMAERSRVLRGVASGELDPEATHASNRSVERALSDLLLSCGLGPTA